MTRPYAPFWPEQVEQDPQFQIEVPSWETFHRESILVRHTLLEMAGRGEEIPNVGAGNPHRRAYGTVAYQFDPKKYDLHNIHHFGILPSMAKMREQLAQGLGRMFIKRTDTLDLVRQSQNELAHQWYHHAMWRRYGRRVYVLDETTYRLLAMTPLPKLPASILAMPEHSFFLKLPPQAFKFGVWNHLRGGPDSQAIDGVMVSMDNIDPDSPADRELAFLAVGQDSRADNRNLAFISLTIGADARLDEVQIDNTGALAPSADRFGLLDGEELGKVLPRVILGFLLYLQSEHPDIEPIDPPPRRAFKEIQNLRQREAALKNQDEKLRKHTRLPILYIGRRLAEEVNSELENLNRRESSGRVWTLDHPVWVRGHWKRQPHGPDKTLRKTIWIRPYLKGPDTAESLKVQARKVQQAKAVT